IAVLRETLADVVANTVVGALIAARSASRVRAARAVRQRPQSARTLAAPVLLAIPAARKTPRPLAPAIVARRARPAALPILALVQHSSPLRLLVAEPRAHLVAE